MVKLTIYVIGAFIVGIILDSFKEELKKFISKVIDKLLFVFRFKVSLYKKKTREILNLFEDEVCDELSQRTKSLEFIYETIDFEKGVPSKWKVIKVEKNMTEDRIEKSIILQIPQSSKYLKERSLMKPEYREAFFFALSRKLALTCKQYEIIEYIEDLVSNSGRLREYQIFSEIIKQKDKFTSMIAEAHRKWTFCEGDVSSGVKREFCKFIDDLSHGKVGTLNIWYERPVKSHLLDLQSSLSRYSIVHIYARGNEKSKNFNVLNKLLKEIKDNMKSVEIEDSELYRWDDTDQGASYQARTIIARKI